MRKPPCTLIRVTDFRTPLRALAEIPDPAERARQVKAALDEMPAIQAELRQLRQAAVLELRAAGLSHADVAKEIGVTRSRAQQIAEGKTTTEAGSQKR